ncbi:hypothetical protein BSKO_03947 [Bryopsis sp. KO-2023]|nr:hypothetical protein BSKO_03947 [Bryopsis sp. KO-2023]
MTRESVPPLEVSEWKTFQEFYPFYLSQHRDRTCRALHFIGTLGAMFLAVVSIATEQWRMLWGVPLIGYGFSWVGHAFFEKNKPATFKAPVYSLLGDFRMAVDMICGNPLSEKHEE